MTSPAASKTALALAAALVLAACGPRSGQGLRTNQLDTQIAAAIGDPSTCVLLADARTGQVVYRYGDDFNCVRALPGHEINARLYDAFQKAGL